ncbi:hypothetical protein HanPSC8_Chr15g0683341 [Helianthus annuus]|nr:hypothetical protein HanPSC8_Chr15g0683341 [Helianthus annuus]
MSEKDRFGRNRQIQSRRVSGGGGDFKNKLRSAVAVPSKTNSGDLTRVSARFRLPLFTR